jgi:hypothetical protein
MAGNITSEFFLERLTCPYSRKKWLLIKMNTRGLHMELCQGLRGRVWYLAL